MEVTSNRFRISPFLGEFRDPEEERAFRQHMQPAMVRHTRIALKVWAICLLLFGLLDYLGLGMSPVFLALMGTRLLIAAFIFAYGYVLLSKPHLATAGHCTMALQIFGFSFFFLIYVLRPEVATFTVGVIGLLFISMFVFIPNRLVYTLIAALTGLVGTLSTMVIVGRPAEIVFGAFVLLMAPILVGFLATQRLQIVQRQQYTMFTRANEANKELKAEIERRKVLEQELSRQATTDPLTGLFNRRQYESLFDRERERSKRNGGHLSLCVADIDFFKRVNDEHGHDAGDQMLKHVADLFSSALRQSDIVGRFGGEEFILLLPDTGLEDAAVVVNRLRQKLEAAPLSVADGQIAVTATFGLTEVGNDDQSIEDVIRRADKALYEGKTGGRNRVVPVPC